MKTREHILTENDITSDRPMYNDFKINQLLVKLSENNLPETLPPISKNAPEYQRVLEGYKELGAIAKDQLKDCFWYWGVARDCSLAMWDAMKGKFAYVHYNGLALQEYVMHVPHYEDDEGMDIFIPFEEVKRLPNGTYSKGHIK